MPFAFTQMELTTDSLYRILVKPVEMQLQVTDAEARIVGFGYGQEIGGAFTQLVYDWEATIYLDRASLDLEPGDYHLQFVDGQLHAARAQRGYVIPDQPVRVAVVSVPEDEEEYPPPAPLHFCRFAWHQTVIVRRGYTRLELWLRTEQVRTPPSATTLPFPWSMIIG